MSSLIFLAIVIPTLVLLWMRFWRVEVRSRVVNSARRTFAENAQHSASLEVLRQEIESLLESNGFQRKTRFEHGLNISYLERAGVLIEFVPGGKLLRVDVELDCFGPNTVRFREHSSGGRNYLAAESITVEAGEAEKACQHVLRFVEEGSWLVEHYGRMNRHAA